MSSILQCDFCKRQKSILPLGVAFSRVNNQPFEVTYKNRTLLLTIKATPKQGSNPQPEHICNRCSARVLREAGNQICPRKKRQPKQKGYNPPPFDKVQKPPVTPHPPPAK